MAVVSGLQARQGLKINSEMLLCQSCGVDWVRVCVSGQRSCRLIGTTDDDTLVPIDSMIVCRRPLSGSIIIVCAVMCGA